MHLPTNYRTHSGILNAAAAVVDILKQYFPMVSTLLIYCQHPVCKDCAVQHNVLKVAIHTSHGILQFVPTVVYQVSLSCLNWTAQLQYVSLMQFVTH